MMKQLFIVCAAYERLCIAGKDSLYIYIWYLFKRYQNIDTLFEM